MLVFISEKLSLQDSWPWIKSFDSAPQFCHFKCKSASICNLYRCQENDLHKCWDLNFRHISSYVDWKGRKHTRSVWWRVCVLKWIQIQFPGLQDASVLHPNRAGTSLQHLINEGWVHEHFQAVPRWWWEIRLLALGEPSGATVTQNRAVLGVCGTVGNEVQGNTFCA